MINKKTYLDVKEANSLFEKYKILHAKTLFSGTMDDCLKYPNLFESTIPALLGLPEIKPNICEGVVIRTSTYQFFMEDDDLIRLIIKNKNSKWEENPKSHIKIKKTKEGKNEFA